MHKKRDTNEKGKGKENEKDDEETKNNKEK